METHIDWKKLLSHIALPLGTGLLSALVTKSSMGAYQLLNKPPFAPPWYFISHCMDYFVCSYGYFFLFSQQYSLWQIWGLPFILCPAGRKFCMAYSVF